MNNADGSAGKAELRRKMRAMRRKLPEQAQAEAAQAVVERLTNTAEYKNACVVMGYMAARGELDIGPILEDALLQGKRVCLPQCGENGEMTARAIAGMEELTPGMLGIMEPGTDAPLVLPEEIDLIVAPGVAFDAQCRRLGQGGGYYDRFLSRTHAAAVGVCHDFALVDELPEEAHDRRMDIVLTPGQKIERKREDEA